jgi:aspartate 1-decarboxylase
MLRTVLNSKIHRAIVTQADIDYIGSISVDKELLAAAGLVENEQVHVLDINNGNRLTTYVIEAEAGSGVICLNGAAARLVNIGDLVIICSYAQVNEIELACHEPKVVLVDDQNKIVKMLGKQKAMTKFAELN